MSSGIQWGEQSGSLKVLLLLLSLRTRLRNHYIILNRLLTSRSHTEIWEWVKFAILSMYTQCTSSISITCCSKSLLSLPQSQYQTAMFTSKLTEKLFSSRRIPVLSARSSNHLGCELVLSMIWQQKINACGVDFGLLGCEKLWVGNFGKLQNDVWFSASDRDER